MNDNYLVAFFERAKIHQGRALAALGHPVSRPSEPSASGAAKTPEREAESSPTDRRPSKAGKHA